MEVETPPFDPIWLYREDHGVNGELVEDEATYTALIQAGWTTSPAHFGLITAPNKEQMLTQRVQTPPPAIAPLPDTDDRVSVLTTEVENLHTLLAAQTRGLDALAASLEELKARVEKGDDPPPASSRRKD